jgi:eukaryotic-like serine/threonine-protein kinase
MKCPRCNSEIPGNASICARCGAVLASVDEAKTLAPDSHSAVTQPVPKRRTDEVAVGVLSPLPGSVPLGSSTSGISGSGATDAFELAPDSNFGSRYRIEALLGEGGMGRVYKALDVELNRVVALKLINPALAANTEALMRFKQELLLASKISHKNVLRIHDMGDVNGVKFISMSFVDGEDLHHLLRRDGRIAVDRAIDIIRQIARALAAAHHEGVMHRDLKPQNIMLDRAGQVYVMDFGLAKSLENTAMGMTRTGDLLGTPRYMAPEQAEGKPVDLRTDIYALGLIAYEMVTGETPFAGDSVFQVMYQRVTQKPKDPRELNPAIPEILARVILRCLEKDSGLRYQTAQEVLIDLDARKSSSGRISQTIPAPAPEPPPASSPSLPVAAPGLLKHRRWIAAGVGIVILVVALVAMRHQIFDRFSSGPSESGIPPLSKGKYVAVLPFQVLGDPSALGYVAQGLDEALFTKLFQLEGVHVAADSAVDKVDKSLPIKTISHELGVNLIIQGTVRGSGGKIAIIVNLEDGAAGNLLWTKEFTGDEQDLLTLEDHIYSELVAAMSLGNGGAGASLHPTENVAAYDLYLKGRELMHQEHTTANYQAAIANFQQAINQDPNFALAQAGLAEASLAMYGESKDGFWAAKALHAAQVAQQLNGALPEVHVALGSAYGATGRSAEAIQELERAAQLSPKSDDVFRRLGKAYLASGRKDNAVAALQKAIQIDPYYWVNYDQLAIAYDTSGDYNKALQAFQHVIQLEPGKAMGYENVGLIYIQEGKYQESLPSLEKALQIEPSFQHYSNLGSAYFFTRRFGDAIKSLEKAVAMSPNQEAVVGNLAEAYLFNGQKDRARATFNQAIELANKELQVNPRNAETKADLALYYAYQGSYDQALQFIQNAQSLDTSNPQYPYNEAIIQSLAEKPNLALQSLREALEKGFPALQAANDPQLSSLQNLDDFKKMLAPYGGKS